jgi:hypothetical protein
MAVEGEGPGDLVAAKAYDVRRPRRVNVSSRTKLLVKRAAPLLAAAFQARVVFA